MNNLLSLIKITFINHLNINKIFKNKKIFLLVLVSIISFGYLYYSNLLKSYNLNPNNFLYSQVFLIINLIIIINLFSSKNLLFNNKDNEFLFSLPLKNYHILISKFCVLFFSNFIISLLLLPCFFIIDHPNSFIYYLKSLIIIIFTPLFPTILVLLFGLIIGFITSKIQFRNLENLLYSIIFISFIMLLNYNSITESPKNLIKKFLYPNYLLISGLNNTYSILISILITIFLLLIIILLFHKLYKKIILRINYVPKSYKNKKYVYKKKNTKYILLFKEVRTLFNIPLYFLNSLFGVIILFFLSIIMLITHSFYNPDSNIDFTLFYLYGSVVIAMVSCTSNSSISLEGKNIWILKSLPIKEKDIFYSKIFTNLIASIPLSVIGLILFGITYNIKYYYIIYSIILYIVSSFFISFLGLIINLLFPKLDFNNYQQVIKHSLSVFVSLSIPFVYLFCMYNVIKFFELNYQMQFILYSFITIILNIIFIIIINTWGIKKFRKLSF